MTEKTLWIARHGNRQDFVDPEWHKTAPRPHDPHLSPDGVEEARQLANRMKREGIDYIISSPCLRAVETAHHVAVVDGLPIRIESGLCEWLNPEWFPLAPEWLTMNELAQRFPEVDRHTESRVSPKYPETPEAMLHRTADVAHYFTETLDGPMLLVGHGASVAGVTRALVPDAPHVEYSTCCLVKMVKRDGRWVLDLHGDVSHLDRSGEATRYF